MIATTHTQPNTPNPGKYFETQTILYIWTSVSAEHMANEAWRSRGNARPYQNRTGITGNGYGMNHVQRFCPQRPSGIETLGATRGRPNIPQFERYLEDDTEAKRQLRRALPNGWDGPVIDQFPNDRIEAVYLVRSSNIRYAQRLSERQIRDLMPGDLVRATVCESTANTSYNIGDWNVTPTGYGMTICKFRYHLLLKKYTKHGVFAPITSREAKWLAELSKTERMTRVGFRKEGEHFTRDELTEGDPEFLSVNDPLELHKGTLEPGSFADLSYLTSFYWSSNITWTGCLNATSTRRVLEMYENIHSVSPELVNEAEATAENDAASTTEDSHSSIALEQVDSVLGNEVDKVSAHEERVSDSEDDTDRPKGTAIE